MKKTPPDKQRDLNFQPGKISKNGFLGNDTRQVPDIILEDQKILSHLNITIEQVADRLQSFIDQGKATLEKEIDWQGYQIRVLWSRGKLPCPFGEPGMHQKIIAIVTNKKLDKQISYSQLNVHLIREHGFFEGKGSHFRLEPDELIKILNITP